LFASPWLVNLAVFIAYPIAASLWFSLCRYDALRAPRFVGLGNYRRLFFEDAALRGGVGVDAEVLGPVDVGAAVAVHERPERAVGVDQS